MHSVREVGEMARIPPVEPEEAGVELRALFQSFQRERGNVPNMFRTMGLRPEIAETAAAHLRAIFSTGTVDARLKEMLSVRVSQINHCAY